MKKEENKVDIFETAFAETIKEAKVVSITKENINLPMTKEERKNWKDLKNSIENEHADRFNRVLTTLPDREFVRVYLKALEFFKPKVTRTTGEKAQLKDTTINIQVNYGK